MTTSKIPDTDSIEELARYWDTHDLTDELDDLEEGDELVFGEGEPALGKARQPARHPFPFSNATKAAG